MKNKGLRSIIYGNSWNAYFYYGLLSIYGWAGTFKSNKFYKGPEIINLADITEGCLLGKAMLTSRILLSITDDIVDPKELDHLYEYEFQSSGPVTFTPTYS